MRKKLIDREGRTVPALCSLARSHGITISDGIGARDLSDRLQTEWLRNETWQYQIEGRKPTAADKQHLSELNMLDAISAPEGSYMGFCVLGATRPAVVKRFSHAVEQYQRGVNSHAIYVLGDNRLLDPEKESASVLIAESECYLKPSRMPRGQLPVNELEMMRLVVEQHLWPPDWDFTFSDVNHASRKPSTHGNVEAFMDLDPPQGTYVVISGQPHLWRQTLVFSKYMPTHRFIPTGYQSPNYPLKTYLDEIARLLYEELALDL